MRDWKEMVGDIQKSCLILNGFGSSKTMLIDDMEAEIFNIEETAKELREWIDGKMVDD